MIIFDLKCSAGHVFEAWFGSGRDYEDQKAGGLVSCPICGAPDIEKAVSAPALGQRGNRSPVSLAAIREDGPADPARVKSMLAAAAAAQRDILEHSESVGDRFAAEARAIHVGDSDNRLIHGRATGEEVADLAEDGIEVMPLPFPLIEDGEEN